MTIDDFPKSAKLQPMNGRYPENEIHKRIKTFLNKRDQGRVMGVLRELGISYDPCTASNEESLPEGTPHTTVISDATINEITMDILGKWPSFEAQSWACKVVHAVFASRIPTSVSSVIDAEIDNVCRICGCPVGRHTGGVLCETGLTIEENAIDKA